VKTTIIFFLLASLFLVPSYGVDSEKPPENLIKHYEWCSTPKDAAEIISRYEAFWSQYHPKDEQYEDAIHHTFVRLTAYRLAALYADAGIPAKCREMLRWLEFHDQAIPK